MGQQAVSRTYYQSPLGWLEIAGSETHISALHFVDEPGQTASEPAAVLAECVQQLREYFDGQRVKFTVSLHPSGTPFQRQVWAELAKIPYGQTLSYRELAERLKQPNAFRAVGNANGKNPISIILPCHRVVGSDGSLTGYGGGLWRKRWLLEHEGRGSSGAK